ncbi:glycosyltransferase [Microbacterium enclense]|uniref:D-inositol 3-phosphate glycosyltransferase n=1 Tax=Microbacterium enclense TaxID=993073 RepID=A0A443JFB2_9MICO|nr:glycosyltransferase [Microbacterium enclense]RWR19188.1 glycosyltransferase [Microbacterium enclense]
MTATIPLAIAHDYVTQRGGAEKVVLALHRAFPDAPLYTTLYEQATTYPEFSDVEIHTSWLNRVGALRRNHRLALPFLPFAAQSVKVPAECTIASSSGWSHGFATAGAKIVYCYSPARWLYQTDTYLGQDRGLRRAALLALRPWMRRWDRAKSKTATTYFAISTVVQERIRDTYGIEAEVLPAPHSVDPEAPKEPVVLDDFVDEGFYLCISRLLPYKNVDKVIDAFRELGKPLVVVGSGPEERRLAEMAPDNVRMVKNISDDQIRWLYSRSRALVSASFEDFGLTPIEAATFGKSAIVLRWGGFLDTILEGETGVYFDQPDRGAIVDAVRAHEAIEWDPERLRAHAETFSEESFARRLREEIQRHTSLDETSPNR